MFPSDFIRNIPVFENLAEPARVETALDLDHADRLLKQVIELPTVTDISRVRRWCAGQVAPHQQAQQRFAIGLGCCEISPCVSWLRQRNGPGKKTRGTPIGVNCRLCETRKEKAARPPSRDHPPLILDENTMRVSRLRSAMSREL